MRRQRRIGKQLMFDDDITVSVSDNLMGESSMPTEPIDNTVENHSIDISSNLGAARHTNNQMRRPGRYHMMYTTICTLAIFTLTFASAFNNIAMFGTRIGRGNMQMKPSTNSILFSTNRHKSAISNQLQINTRKHIAFTSLKMSDMDVQSQQTEKSNVEDEDEWRTVLAAFQMYKAAYGDLKVPSRFIVPGMAPWPGKLL